MPRFKACRLLCENLSARSRPESIAIILFSIACLIGLSFCSSKAVDDHDPVAGEEVQLQGAETSSHVASSEPIPARDDIQQSQENKVVQSDNAETDAVRIYRRLLRQKRASHLEAIQKLLQLGSYEKQFKMIQLILTKLFTVLSDARVKLMEHGYTPGDPFPTAENVRDVLSIVIENTAFLGDITLRLPDITHVLLRNNTAWQSMVKWGVGFCNDTRILEGSEAKLIDLMAQELGIVDKSPEFVNPYREDAKLESLVDREAEKVMQEHIKAAKKKERQEKKKRRGPKLTSPTRTEL